MHRSKWLYIVGVLTSFACKNSTHTKEQFKGGQAGGNIDAKESIGNKDSGVSPQPTLDSASTDPSSTLTPSTTPTLLATAGGLTPTPTATGAPLATSTPTINPTLLFSDDFEGPNTTLINPAKWSMWFTSIVGIANGRTTSDDSLIQYAIVKDLLVSGNFTISADFSITGPEVLGKLVKLWAICGPNVTMATNSLGSYGSLLYEGQIIVNQYLQRLGEVSQITPGTLASVHTTPNGPIPTSGTMAFHMDTSRADLFINGNLLMSLNLSPRVSGPCRIVFGQKSFTIDNFAVHSSP